jgi:hypothetical protein
LAIDRAGCDANHIATNFDYEESLRRGILAECAFVHHFGECVDIRLLEKGDGGRDFLLSLDTGSEIREFPINIKAKSVRSSFAGMVEVGTHLRVPVRDIKPYTIYVFAVYYEQLDAADVLRWDWGITLMRLNQRMVFANGNGEPAYVKRYEDLRDLQELKTRMRPYHRPQASK